MASNNDMELKAYEMDQCDSSIKFITASDYVGTLAHVCCIFFIGLFVILTNFCFAGFEND